MSGRFSRALLALWTLLFRPFLGAAQAPPDSAAIRGILQDRVDARKQSVGIVVGVVDRNGSRVVGYGRVAKDRAQEPDGATVFEIGSITKAFTAVLLQDMAERGEVKLDDPIAEYLPGTVKVPARNGKEITLLHLATHTSALPRLPDNMNPADLRNPYADYTVEQMYDFLARCSLPRDIGAEYEYSNFGAGLLGHILALRAGADYESLVKARIAGPLGMSSTGIRLSPELRARLAQGYDAAGQPAPGWDLPALAGAGALRSTVDDLLRFVAANLGLAETALTPVLRKTHAARQKTGEPGVSVGLGWHILEKHGNEIVWHNGGTGGYRSFLGFDKARGVGVVVLSNSESEIDDIGLHLIDSRFELAKGRTAIALDPKVYDAYAGHYELQPGFVITVTKEADRLFAQATGQGKAEVFPESETKFFYTVVDAQLTFVRDGKGQVTHLILHQNGRDMQARRLGPDYQPPPPRKEVAVKPEILKAYVGRYELMPGVVFDVSLDGDKLMVQITGQPRIQVYPESETKFFYKVVEAQITFQKDAEGKVTGLALHQGGLDHAAKRIR